jgi:hypothetical protein
MYKSENSKIKMIFFRLNPRFMIEPKSGEFFERTPRTQWKLGIPPWMRRRRKKKRSKVCWRAYFFLALNQQHTYIAIKHTHD